MQERHVARRVLEHRGGLAFERRGSRVHQQQVGVLLCGQPRHVAPRGRGGERGRTGGDPAALQFLGAIGELARGGAEVVRPHDAREDQLARRPAPGESRCQREQRVERVGGAREDQQRPLDPRRRCARGRRGGRGVQLGIVAEDGALEPPQLLAGLEAELVGELAPHSAVGLQRLRLAAGTVEREHELGPQALAQRVRGDQRLELADEVCVASACKVGVDPLLKHRQPQLVELPDLGLGERLVREVGERRAAPEGECGAQLVRRPHGLRSPRLPAQPLEHREVELLRLDVQDVAGRARGQPLGAELAPQPHDVDLDALRRRGGRRLSPQLGDQPVGGNDLVRVQQQEGEQRTLLEAAER